MKHIHADKIMQFAKMVEAGHPIDELVQIVDGNYQWKWNGLWLEDKNYRVAIAFVEGKPVFKGDMLYAYGILIRVDRVVNADGTKIDLQYLSWKSPKAPDLNPPKPITFAEALKLANNMFSPRKIVFDADGDKWVITYIRSESPFGMMEVNVKKLVY